MPKYRALVGIEFPPDRRVEAGEVADDIPANSIKWLSEQGLIELVDQGAKPQPAEDDAIFVAKKVGK
jgi:hypothetical protein